MIHKKGINYNRTLPLSYLFKDDLEQFNNFIPSQNYIFLSTGRCAIKLAIRMLGLSYKDEILLPSYLCPSILEPIREEGINIKFFKVKKDLSVDINDIKKKISNTTKILFVIHYFGFPQQIGDLVELCNDKKLFLIEDCAHAFLSKYGGNLLGSFGDLSIFTYRKTLPVPDGALLVCNNPSITSMQTVKIINLIRSLYSLMEINVLLLAHGFTHLNFVFPITLLGGMSYLNKKLITSYYKPTSPSYISQSLIRKFNLEEIISIKRENFKYLLENLKTKGMKPLYTELPNGVCPLWFPILTENRDDVRKRLKKEGYSTPIFWKLPKGVDKVEFYGSWEVSNQILSIPLGCVQPINMPRIIKILSSIK